MKKKNSKSTKVVRLVKSPVLLYSVLYLFNACTFQKSTNNLSVGFGKSNLSSAGIYIDPISTDQFTSPNQSSEESTKEDKFAISDKVEGRWRPGSGGTRRLVDSIYVSAMYGEDNNGPWAIITIDETSINYKQLDHLEYPLIHQMQIPKDRLVFLPSHGHSTPPMDPDKYQQAVFDAVLQAKNSMTEVEVASMNLILNGNVINRRVHINNLGSRTVMFNDDCIVGENYLEVTDHLHRWIDNLGGRPKDYLQSKKSYVIEGKDNNELHALFLKDSRTGELKGSFLQFAAHAVIVSSKVVNGDVSADFPGYMKNKIERDLGGIALFGQGACGDLRPLNIEYTHEFAKQYGEGLASEILRKFHQLNWQPLVKLTYYTEPVNLPLLDNIYFTDEELKTEMDKVESKYDQEGTSPLQKRILQNKYWGLYRTPWVHQMVRSEWRGRKELNLKLFALQLNDNVILATQGEIFDEIGQDMIKPFADKKPILVSIANEYISYVPTDPERKKGGYEPSVSIVKEGSPNILVQAAHKLLARIYEN